ncbi:hypothetical protein ACS0TY_005295 [Phlomoides rotata]
MGMDGVSNSRGILTIWNPNVFQKISDWCRMGMLVVNGRWVEDGSNCTIVNVYSPNSATHRCELWEILQALVRQVGTESICIIGDFNAIREESEGVGRSRYWDRGEMEKFNDFIERSDLVEVQLVGRRFTWYRPDGTCKSKLDRLLVNSTWLNNWSGSILRGGKRSLSDHVPIYIEGSKKDWGPRPFKFFNQWIQHPSYKGLVEKVWSSSLKQGWAGFVIKEKLKELKMELKEWSTTTFKGMDRRIEEKNDELERLDILDDTFGLDEEEISRRQEVIWNCDSSGSPGPDSFSFGFFKYHWELLKEEIMRMFAEFHSNGKLVTDDTLFLCDGGVDSLKQAKRVLRLFELTAGLRVNFRKSCVNKPKIGAAERWKWKHSKDGAYKVNKAYTVILDKIERPNMLIEEEKTYKKLWKSWAIKKATITAWRILKEKVATKDNLAKR